MATGSDEPTRPPTEYTQSRRHHRAMFLDFRISELLGLTIGHVMHHGHIAPRPASLKGKRGDTPSVPIWDWTRAAPCARMLLRTASTKTRPPLRRRDPVFLPTARARAEWLIPETDWTRRHFRDADSTS